MFFVTISIVSLSRSVGLNSTSDVPAKMRRRVPGADEVGVPAHELLVPVRRVEHDLALEHEAPVLTLAAVVGQAREQRRHVRVRRVRLPAHRGTAELRVVALEPFQLDVVRGARLRCLRHLPLPSFRRPRFQVDVCRSAGRVRSGSRLRHPKQGSRGRRARTSARSSRTAPRPQLFVHHGLRDSRITRSV